MSEKKQEERREGRLEEKLKKNIEEGNYAKKLPDILNMNEINRLHRAAKNKDKKEIIKWTEQYDRYVNNKYYEIYKKEYVVWLEETFEDLDIALMYTLHFNESTRFGTKRLQSVMEDIAATMKGFYTKEFSREEYKKMLEDDGIKIEKMERK